MRGMTTTRIPLKGRNSPVRAWALIDADDYERLVIYNWFVQDPRSSTGSVYAVRNNWNGQAGINHRVRMHREIMGLEKGDKRDVDHINGNTLDNRKANLRVVTHQQNRQNTRGWANASSQYRGVSWDKSRGRWKAQASVGGKNRLIGRFKTEEEANAAAIAFRAEHMPFAARDAA